MRGSLSLNFLFLILQKVSLMVNEENSLEIVLDIGRFSLSFFTKGKGIAAYFLILTPGASLAHFWAKP